MMMTFNRPLKPVLLFACAALFLNACETAKVESKYPTSSARKHDPSSIYEEEEGIFGEGGLFGAVRGDKKKSDDSVLGVNSFLWRASLETVSFMPLVAADPFGGTILTDWHMPEGQTHERFKVNVFVTTRELSADGVRVTVFRQRKLVEGEGENVVVSWVDAPLDKETAMKLEDSILTRARQLRLSKLDAE